MVAIEGSQALVVSGFLGSGKTSLVRHLLEEGHRRGIRTAVVSNEFGDLGIDEALLADTTADYVELSGGCVCCRLSDDLLVTLQRLWETAHPERVIVETSGLALPYDTLLNFWRDPVRAWARDESAIVVVNAEQVAAGRDLDGLFVDQVCSADLLVLNKTDLVSDRQYQHVCSELQRMQPGVEIVHCTFGDIDERIVFPPDPRQGPASRRAEDRRRKDEEPREDAGSRRPHSHEQFRSSQIETGAAVDPEELLARLRARAALRVKGFVETAQGVRLVQGVAGRIEISPPPSPPPAALVGRLVVIERATEAPAAQTAGGAPPAGAPPGSRRDADEEKGDG